MSKNKPETAERAMTFTPEGGRLKRPNIWRGREEGGGRAIITVGIARIPENQLFMHSSHQTSA